MTLLTVKTCWACSNVGDLSLPKTKQWGDCRPYDLQHPQRHPCPPASRPSKQGCLWVWRKKEQRQPWSQQCWRSSKKSLQRPLRPPEHQRRDGERGGFADVRPKQKETAWVSEKWFCKKVDASYFLHISRVTLSIFLIIILIKTLIYLIIIGMTTRCTTRILRGVRKRSPDLKKVQFSHVSLKSISCYHHQFI